MARRYSLRLDGRTIALPASVTDDNEAERYARIAVLARHECEAQLGSLGWQVNRLGRYRRVFRASVIDPACQSYVGVIQCHETEPDETGPKKTS